MHSIRKGHAPAGAARRVVVRHTAGKRLLGTARGHTVVADRPAADGGTDTGFMSGELLLIALGSCVVGSLIRSASELVPPSCSLSAMVEYAPTSIFGQPDPILVTLSINRPEIWEEAERLIKVALSGGVGFRLNRSSEILIRFCDDESCE